MLTMKDIILDGDAILRERAETVSLPPCSEDLEILDKMMQYLKNSQDKTIREEYQLRAGVGLAAPQIGISKQLISIYFHFDDELYEYKLINPKIISHSVKRAFLSGGEGCLSVEEEIEGYVVRHARITVKAYNIKGEPVKLKFKGYPAIVIQHEVDHLKGIMFYDYINEENPFHIPENAEIIE